MSWRVHLAAAHGHHGRNKMVKPSFYTTWISKGEMSSFLTAGHLGYKKVFFLYPCRIGFGAVTPLQHRVPSLHSVKLHWVETQKSLIIIKKSRLKFQPAHIFWRIRLGADLKLFFFFPRPPSSRLRAPAAFHSSQWGQKMSHVLCGRWTSRVVWWKSRQRSGRGGPGGLKSRKLIHESCVTLISSAQREASL